MPIQAFAKFSFNYHNLSGGHGILALVAMTGETDCILYRRNKHLPQWEVTSDVLVVRSDKGASSEKVGELQKGTKFEEIRFLSVQQECLRICLPLCRKGYNQRCCNMPRPNS